MFFSRPEISIRVLWMPTLKCSKKSARLAGSGNIQKIHKNEIRMIYPSTFWYDLTSKIDNIYSPDDEQPTLKFLK